MGLLLLVACSTDGESLGTRRLEGIGPGTHRLDDFPLATRSDAAFVWTGKQLFVWSGLTTDDPSARRRSLGDGAVLDAEARWRRLSDSPYPHGLYGSTGAWDGTEVIVIGSDCDESVPPATTGEPPRCTSPAAVAWDPRTDRWRLLAAPPIPVDPQSGEAVIRWRAAAVGADGAALFVDQQSGTTLLWNRRSGRWATVPSPVGGPLAACADPTELWVVAMAAPYGATAPGDHRLRTIRPASAGVPVWSDGIEAQVQPDVQSCGAGQVIGNAGLQVTLVDVATGISTPVAAADAVNPARPSLVTSASLVGAWLFTASSTPQPPPSTTTIPLEQASRGSSITLEPAVDWGRPEWSAQLVPDGAPTPVKGNDFNLFVWAGTTVATDDGLISCDLRFDRSCVAWVGPVDARPRR